MSNYARPDKDQMFSFSDINEFAIYHKMHCLQKMNSFKGTGHDLFWSETPTYHLQRQCKIHINQNKENPHKIADIFNETGVLAHFII